MSNHYCPVDDCNYPPDSDGVSLSRVRSHINATSEAAHEWDDLKPVVLDQGTKQAEPSDDLSGEQAASEEVDTPPRERDEYEEQWDATQKQETDTTDGGEDASKGEEAADKQTASSHSSGRRPVSTPVIVVGLGLVVLVAFLAVRTPSGELTTTSGDTNTDNPRDEAGSGDPGEPDIPEEGAWG